MDARARSHVAPSAAELDAEHDRQRLLIEAVRGALVARRDRATVSALLCQLQDASAAHFASEERLMRRHAWHRAAAHEVAHRRLLEGLATLRRDFETAASVELAVVLEQLKCWLAGHVQGMDRDFASHLARAGTGPAVE
jgi:hemerythrin